MWDCATRFNSFKERGEWRGVFLTEDGAKKSLSCWEPKDVGVDQFPAKVILLCGGGRRGGGERIRNGGGEGRRREKGRRRERRDEREE